ncbi:MAG: hypothetical protein HZA82_01750 [Thaumarchaeota archaeon]|nr:hypothetical protein [Nitrososphaerota archaeon]
MNKPIVFGATILALFVASTFIPMAAAQYAGVGGGGQYTIEEQLDLAKAKVKKAADNPATGSGTPYFDVSGVAGASVIVGGIFGGIAIAFFLRGRSGRFAKAK